MMLKLFAYTADVGQEIDRKKIIKNAKKLGVKNIIIENLKDIFVKDYVFQCLEGTQFMRVFIYWALQLQDH